MSACKNEYRGEYMRQYGWSEFTNGWLEKQAEKRKGAGPEELRRRGGISYADIVSLR